MKLKDILIDLYLWTGFFLPYILVVINDMEVSIVKLFLISLITRYLWLPFIMIFLLAQLNIF